MLIPQTRPRAAEILERAFAPVERLFVRVHRSTVNPLHHTGALSGLFLLVAIVTGVYLLCFYRVSAPYESTVGLPGQWIRALHRYAADAALAAAFLHGLRMFLRGRTWGARALAWLSGLALVLAVLVCGWTGLVLVWDRQAQLVALEAVRLLDHLPLFPEPLSRLFAAQGAMPNSFFFVNLFLHVAAPLGMAACLWIHVSRVARPTLMPPRGLAKAAVALLTVVSVAWPLANLGPADLGALPGRMPVDLFYGFWLALPGGLTLAGVLVLVSVPFWWKPRQPLQPAVVDTRSCTGCTQCYQDCPYGAISMVPRENALDRMVSRVDPDLCASCGICAASCGPMSIGPPGRTGREQLAALATTPGEVVVFACANGPSLPGVRRVACAGSLHTSLIEAALRNGAAGVLVVTCPGDDALHREGPKGLHARIHDGREADLKPRVDRQRVRLVACDPSDPQAALRELERFREDLPRA